MVDNANKKLPPAHQIHMRRSSVTSPDGRSQVSKPAFEGTLVVFAPMQGETSRCVITVLNTTTTRAVIANVLKQTPSLQSVSNRVDDYELTRRTRGAIAKRFAANAFPLAEVLNMDSAAIATAFGEDESAPSEGFFIELIARGAPASAGDTPQSPDQATGEADFAYTKSIGDPVVAATTGGAAGSAGERATSGGVLQRSIDVMNSVLPDKHKWRIHPIAPGVFEGSLRVYLKLPGGEVTSKMVMTRNQGLHSTAQCVLPPASPKRSLETQSPTA